MPGLSKFLVLLCCFIIQSGLTQQSAEEFQEEMNTRFANPEESPLEPEDLKKFTGLEFFEIDPDYRVTAEFVRTPSQPTFTMKTSSDRLPVYVKYGEVYFKLKGKEYQLSLYQNQELVTDPHYFDYLFFPFTDLTNGKSTYGGGRYLDLRIPETNEVILNFNKAYNPYCAYNGRYSCPIPPAENALDTEIPAGVKAYNK